MLNYLLSCEHHSVQKINFDFSIIFSRKEKIHEKIVIESMRIKNYFHNIVNFVNKKNYLDFVDNSTLYEDDLYLTYLKISQRKYI